MGKAFSVEFGGFAEMNRRLLRMEADARAVAEEALKATRDIVTEAARVGMEDQYLPAGGKYSRDRTEETLRPDTQVKWNGDEATLEAGFDLKMSPVSLFLMYGTPKMVKDQKLYDAFYGQEIRQAYLAAQKEIYERALEKVMGNEG